MCMNRIIRYGVDQDTGVVVSQVGSELAWPILQYEAMQPENNFQATYQLERIPQTQLYGCRVEIQWTRKVPLKLKNRHRQFWGMPLLNRTELRYESEAAA